VHSPLVSPLPLSLACTGLHVSVPLLRPRLLEDLQARLRSALADHYLIDRELGRGGMATVYLAHDLRHRRPVAVKVLHPELAYVVGADRFLREIEVAANLNHPHILPLFDSGEVDGLLYYVMPYVPGESLRNKLKREIQLPVGEALTIAREVADALNYAHGQGIIHRDIKPENILRSGEHALVTDFGIARAVEQAGGARLTESGLAVGTAAYMSPEQASGERQLDGRSDIYSLGCVLYEMLAGEPPYTGPSAQAIVAKRLNDPVPSVRRVRPAVPEELDQAVTRALATVAADRFVTAHDFLRALAALGASADLITARAPPVATQTTAVRPTPRSRTLGLAAALAIAMAAGGVLWQRSHEEGGPSGPTRLAVLPFENLGDSADAYFADGITDAVRGKLAALRGVQVTTSSSSGVYKETTKTPQQIGRELDVQYLLRATVRWLKVEGGMSRVQVTSELVQVASASTKWQQPFDASLTDVFQVQKEIAGRVAQALGVALGVNEQKALADQPTEDLAAYDAFLKGNQIFYGSGGDPGAMSQAAEWYDRAVGVDSNFVLAWSQLSRAHSWVYFNTPAAPEAERQRAKAAAERALILAPQSPDAHLAMGVYHYAVENDNEKAQAEYARGLTLAPNSEELLINLADVELARGQYDQSLAHVRAAQILAPRSILVSRRLAERLLWLRRYQEARQETERALALAPESSRIYQLKIMIFLAEGDLAGARSVLAAAASRIGPRELAVEMSVSWDLFWVLDNAGQTLVRRLRPASFYDDPVSWGLAQTGIRALHDDSSGMRAFADTTRMAAKAEIKESPGNAQMHAFLGLAYGYLGQGAEAVREGRAAVALRPLADDALQGAYLQHQLVRIYLLVGEPEKALDQLEALLKIPYYLSPGWLKIDPNFDPLRGNPRFQRLVEGGA